MKLKHLLAVALMAIGGSAWAQNPSISNGGFDTESDWTSSNVTLNNPIVKVGASEWTVSAGNSWCGVATFQLGSSALLNNAAVPATGAKGETTGGVMGVAASWGSYAAYEQEITLPAGGYKITYDAYEANANANDGVEKNLIGFIAEGKEYLSKKTAYTKGQWSSDEIQFTLTEETTGKISVGYKSKNVTSNNTPKLFIDNLAIEYVNPVVVAKENALAALPTGDESLFTPSADAVASAKAAIEAATTVEEVETAVASLTIPALSGEWAILNATNGLYLGDAVLSAESKTATFEQANGGFYIKIGDKYINMRGDNNWSMSADATAKTAWTFSFSDNKYTIKGPKGLIGTDATTAGSAVYGDKAVGNNGYWTIVDLAAAALESAKGALQELVDNMTVPTANIELSTSNPAQWGYTYVTNLTTAINGAKDLIANSNSVDDVNACIDALNAMTPEVILPSLNKPYSIIMAKDGLAWTGNAVTFTYSEGNQNNYAMAYSDVAGQTNFNQVIYFGQNANDEIYMYITDADGKNWYVTDGTHVGSDVAWAASQIRMTDVEADAMPISILPSRDKENVCEITNEWTGEHVGSTNNNGFYCSNDNYDLTIQGAAYKQELITLAANYGTVILPAEYGAVPQGFKFYSVSSVNGDVLELTEESNVLANTPYIMEGEVGEAFLFRAYANAYKASYTSGLLTGVYTATAAPVGSYVLQNQAENGLGFYVVEDAKTVPANKAYLTVPAAASARAFFFGGETAISAVEALTSGKAEIYNINGVKINKLEKGINIVNGKKIMVK